MAPAPLHVCEGAWDKPLPLEQGRRAQFIPTFLPQPSAKPQLAAPRCPLQKQHPTSLCPCSLSLFCGHPALPLSLVGGGLGFALWEQTGTGLSSGAVVLNLHQACPVSAIAFRFALGMQHTGFAPQLFCVP